MAIGLTMDKLEQAGFYDADPRHQPTMMLGGIAVAQLDHIMVRDIHVARFVLEPDECSDHRAASAILET
jgi:hypothetical protein